MYRRNLPCFVIGLSLVMAGQLLGSRPARAQQNPPIRPGAKAPNFVTRTLDGKRLSLRGQRGHVVLVEFWATWCEPCQMAAPAMEALYKRFSSRGFRIVGLSLDGAETKSNIPAYVKEFGITYTLAYSPEANYQTAMAYHMNTDPNAGTIVGHPMPPGFFLIDKKGRVRWSQVGYSLDEPHELAVQIKKLLAERG